MTAFSLQFVARALGGEVSGHQVLAPGPGHSARDRSLSIRPDPRAPGGFLVYSHCGDDPLEAKDFVRRKLGLSRNFEALPSPAQRASTVLVSASRSAQTTARAMAIWAEALNPYGTPVEAYLTRCKREGGRGLPFPHDAAGEAIRFHPACPFAGSRTPAMVCLVRDVRTNEPRAIHRTALTLRGLKANIGGHERLALGPVAGGAIKLTPDEEVTACLGIGEGLESTLTLRLAQEFGPSPVWSLLSAGGVGGLPVLPGIECLWIAVDHDPAGIAAAESCAARWCNAGRHTFLLKPRTERQDLNDIVKGEKRHA
ncbi:DUF7146 domain-containing protein [Microvirga sp. P5_D2]